MQNGNGLINPLLNSFLITDQQPHKFIRLYKLDASWASYYLCETPLLLQL